MPNDVIITPSTGRVQFVKDTGQALLRYNIDLSAATGLTIDSPLTSSVGIKSPNLPDLSGNNTFTGTSTFNGPTVINGNLSVYGATNIFSASNIYITSSVLTVTDNILTLNALSPYQRYAGIEMYDTGSGTISSILWDGTNDYFFLTGSGVNGKLITGPDGQTNLTSGYIPKATAGYKLGNSVVYDDGTRVGINTVSPSGSLTIQTNGTHLRLQTQNAPGSIFANIGARYDTTRPFTIEVANNNSTAAEFMGVYADGGGLDNRVVFPTGNVGIGLTNPSAKFHVTSSTNADEVLIGTIGNDQIVGGRTGGSFGIATKSTSNGNLILTSGNALYIRTSGSNDRVIVKNDGNVGIGTTSPAQLLELKKTTGSAIALLNYNDSVKFNINASSGGAGYVGMVTNHDLIFVTNDTERARLTSTGCVGIGTTSVRLNSLLTVYGSGAFGTSDYGFYVGTDATGTFLDAGTQLIRMFAGQVERIRIATDGNVGIGTTTTVARLHVNSTTSGATLLRTDGTNGTLFSVVDDLSDSLMSVNNSAGLPVLEVFADDRIVAGQYGQNDLVVRNNYVGIGTNNPTAKLCVSGSTSTPTAVFLVGNVGIGTTSPGYKLDVNGLASSTNGFLSRGSFSGMSGLSGALIDYDSGNTRIISNTAAGNSTISFLIGNSSAFSNAMVINSDGNVGIGTTTVGNKLTIVTSTQYDGYYLRNVNGVVGTMLGVSATNDDGTVGLYSNAVLKTNITANGVSYFNGGSVGIGTSSPLAKLHVNSSVAIANFDWTSLFAAPTVGLLVANNSGSAAIRIATLDSNSTHDPYLNFLTSGGQNWSVGVDNSDSDKLKISMAAGFATNEFLTIDTSGNLGIGTTAPAAKLHISGSSNDQLPQLIVHGVGAPATFNWASTFINSALSSSRNYISLIGQALSTRNSGYIGFNHSGTDGSTSNFLTFGLYGVDNILNINGNGRVGIGTTNPTQKLDIVGSYAAAGDSSGILKIRGGATGADTQLNFGVSADNGYGWIQATDVGLTNNINIILNPLGGNVGIGTTSPAYKLDVSGSSRFGYQLSDNHYFTGSINISGSLNLTGSQNMNGPLYMNNYNIEGINTLIINDPGSGEGILWSQGYGWGIYECPNDFSNTGGNLQFVSGSGTVNVRRLTLNTDGNAVFPTGSVGVGTDSLSSWGSGRTTVELFGTSTATYFSSATYNNHLSTNYYYNSGHKFINASNRALYYLQRYDGQHQWFTSTADSSGAGSSATMSQLMTLTNTGTLGIGTTAPSTYSSQVAIETSLTRGMMVFNTALADAGTLYGLGFGYAMSNYNSAYISFYKVGNSNTLNRLGFSLWNQNDILNILGNGNVGIGTTGPISRLNVYASGSNLSVLKVDGGNGTLFEVTDNLSGSLFSVNTIAGLPVLEVFSDNKIVAGQYGTNDFVISGSKIGIGTSSPSTKLYVNGTGYFASTLYVNDADPTLYLQCNTLSGTHYSKVQFVNQPGTVQSEVYAGVIGTGGLYLANYSNNGIFFGVSNASGTFTERVRIANDGNVGIGTTSPSGKLHVVGNADIGDSTADTGIIVRHGAGSAQYGRIRFYDSNGLNVNTIHSFPVAWQGGTLLNSSAGAVNITGWNGVTFGSWNNVDVAFASNGTNYFKGNVGIGTTTPSASLHINSTTAGATLLRTDGTNGTLFSVVDDLSDSLMSVNNSAGLPVFEVFADDRIVSGQYGQNDLIVINNKVGIGTNNPLGKLHVTGSSSTPAAIFLGSVGIGTTSPTNALTVSGSANITGALTKGSGTFLINHPDPAKPGWKLQHSFVESPTVGDNIYRYIIDIDNTLSGSIELPSYWKFLNENPQIWINPVKHFGIAYGELNEELSVMNVYANSAGKYNILLIGTRKDPTIKRLMPEFNVEFESK